MSIHFDAVNADVLLKATNVEGVYNCHADDSSVTLDHISFGEAPSHVIPMDMMAIQFCEENRIPGNYYDYICYLPLCNPPW